MSGRVRAGLVVLALLVAGGVTVHAENKDPLLTPEALNEQAPDLFRVKFETSKGDFVVEVHREWAPRGADRFYNLVKNGFYDDTGFFRVMKVPRPFVIQFGLSGRPEVNAAWRGARIKDDPVNQSNTRGYVTYAKTREPNSRTTQVFINLGDNAQLDEDGFAPFGRVIKGMKVVEWITGEYGQTPNQGAIVTRGNAYLKENFPNLDYINKATILP